MKDLEQCLPKEAREFLKQMEELAPTFSDEEVVEIRRAMMRGLTKHLNRPIQTKSADK